MGTAPLANAQRQVARRHSAKGRRVERNARPAGQTQDVGEHSTSFGQAAGMYSAARPSYPRDAVAWLLGNAAHVVDVGAGTGKLTQVVRDLGRAVTAVDPDWRMLQQLARDVAGVVTHVGTAESMPLPDASADAVLLGQAWHWVDVPDASQECGRVLRPGGVLGLVWNVRDERVAWVAALTDVMHGSAAEDMIALGAVSLGPPFGALQERRWEWSRELRPEQIVDLAASRSYLITLPEPDRAAVLDDVRGLLATHPDTAGRDQVTLPYVTVAFRTVRP